MAYGHIHGNMLAEVEGFPDAMRLVDLMVETVWYALEQLWNSMLHSYPVPPILSV